MLWRLFPGPGLQQIEALSASNFRLHQGSGERLGPQLSSRGQPASAAAFLIVDAAADFVSLSVDPWRSATDLPPAPPGPGPPRYLISGGLGVGSMGSGLVGGGVEGVLVGSGDLRLPEANVSG